LAKGHITPKEGPKELDHLSSNNPSKVRTILIPQQVITQDLNLQEKIWCFICKKMGHGIKDCRVHLAEKKTSNMQSNIATKHNQLYVATLIIFDSSDNTWYVDTGATNHMTHDIE
jgi:hypothetical protein